MTAVSIVIPVHDAGALLREALASVARQRVRDVEVIVVDDGSTDDPERWITGCGMPVRLIRQDNRGPAAARNVGITHSRSPLLAFLDADDIWPHQALARLLARLEESLADVAQGHVQRFRTASADEGEWPFTIVGPPKLGFNVGGALFRRSVFDRIGLFDEAFRTAEDVDLWVRIRESRRRHVILPDTTLLYRRGNGGMMEQFGPRSAAAEHLRRWATILHGSLQRRRRADGA